MECTYLARRFWPDQIVDDGDATLLIHKGVELETIDWVNTPSDNHEEQVIKNLLQKTSPKNPDIGQKSLMQ